MCSQASGTHKKCKLTYSREDVRTSEPQHANFSLYIFRASSYELSSLILAQVVDQAFQHESLSLLFQSFTAGKDLLPEGRKVHSLTARKTTSQCIWSLPTVQDHEQEFYSKSKSPCTLPAERMPCKRANKLSAHQAYRLSKAQSTCHLADLPSLLDSRSPKQSL